MRIADGGGGSGATIVLNPNDLRKTAALLGAAAQEDQALAKQIGGHALPDMPGDVAARVQTTINEVSTGLGSEPNLLIEVGRELRARALWGDIADKLAAGYDLSDSELNEFKATMHDGTLLKYADDPFYVQLAKDYAQKVHDREHPGGVWGFVKSVGHGLADFAEGAWDAIKDPAVMLYHLSPLSSGWTHNWANLGKGLEYAAEHPLEFGKAVINLDALEKRGVAYWLGNLAPAAIATVMSGGGAAALRGVSATDRVIEAGTAADRLAAGASDVSRLSQVERDLGGAAALSSVEEAAPGAIRLTAPTDRFGEFASRATPLEGHTDVIVHGSPTEFARTPSGPILSHRDVANLTLRDPEFNGGPVRLIACNAGCPGSTAAQNLANKLGTEVLAPNDTVWAFRSGELTIGPTAEARTGDWVRFFPGGPRP
jgi:hypothetical protein